ncbi:MAG: SGNH/GDSL hydrolase family protein [archaeon]|nr:MAG: SGNH/GDSL hydrolase family protein [archaeon]
MLRRIFVFGNSLAWGMRDFEEGGWVDRLKIFHMKRGQFNEVFNLADPGSFSSEIVKYIGDEINVRVNPAYGDVNLVIIQTGINDSSFMESKKDFRVPPEDFEKNLQKMIKISRKFISATAFVGLIPVDESRTNPIEWDKDTYYKNEDIKKYNKIIKKVCEENNAYFIDIFSEITKMDYKKYLTDGVHPSAEIHKRIFEIVRDFLLEKKLI